jgi:hypothetical protein
VRFGVPMPSADAPLPAVGVVPVDAAAAFGVDAFASGAGSPTTPGLDMGVSSCLERGGGREAVLVLSVITTGDGRASSSTEVAGTVLS